MAEFRRGKEHIEKANDRAQGGGGEFRPFIQNFFWKDGDSHYLLFLNPIDDIPMVSMQQVFIDGRPHSLVARTDDAIGEKVDQIEKQWDYDPKDQNVCVAVSLIPTVEIVKKRKRPTGFEVETRTYERRIRLDNGELSEDRETVTTPVVGVVAQSPNNFFNKIASTDANIGPINEAAMRITRVGARLETDYEVEYFDDKPLDLTNLIEFVDGISYLGDDMDPLLEWIDEGDHEDLEIAERIGSVLLDRRLDEMCDEEYYNEVLEGITEPAKFSKKRREAQAKEKTARPARQSQRRRKAEAPAEATEPVEDTPAPVRRSRAAVTQESPAREKVTELRKRAAAKADAAE